MEPTIACPNCKSEIKLTESLAAPLVESTRLKYEQQLASKETDFAKREAGMRNQLQAVAKEREAVAKERAEIEEQVAQKLATQRTAIAAEEAKKARRLLENDLQEQKKEMIDLQGVLKDRETKLAAAQKAQADFARKERELEDAQRELELTVQKQVSEQSNAIREKAKHEAEEGMKLKVAEREEKFQGMQRQIEELKRKAEQGSQQLQGEALELELETLVKATFPLDTIAPVPKGEFGGDLIHSVVGPLGQHCGTILWEAKRTKNWSDTWLPKLRDDQRTAKAEIALIVSHALPKDVEHFHQIDGVWITSPRCAMPVAMVLRHSLLSIASARQATEGQQTKMELVYRYLTGPSFRHRIEAIVEKISDMHADLDKERKTMTKLWAKREAQIRCVIESTAGMYGDLQGIAGRSLEEIAGLEIEPLELTNGEIRSSE
jgi:hypothetical protein